MKWWAARIRGDYFPAMSPPASRNSPPSCGFLDASIRTSKTASDGEMYICAMIAAAAVCDDIPAIIEAGLSTMPPHGAAGMRICAG